MKALVLALAPVLSTRTLATAPTRVAVDGSMGDEAALARLTTFYLSTTAPT